MLYIIHHILVDSKEILSVLIDHYAPMHWHGGGSGDSDARLCKSGCFYTMHYPPLCADALHHKKISQIAIPVGYTALWSTGTLFTCNRDTFIIGWSLCNFTSVDQICKLLALNKGYHFVAIHHILSRYPKKFICFKLTTLQMHNSGGCGVFFIVRHTFLSDKQSWWGRGVNLCFWCWIWGRR